MYIVMTMLDTGKLGMMKFFSDEEVEEAKDLYAKIRVDYIGKELDSSPVIGDKASEGTISAKVSLLHTVNIDEDLFDKIKIRKDIYDKSYSMRSFSSDPKINDTTGVNNSTSETLRFSRFKGDPDVLYWSEKFNEEVPRKELNIIGFDSNLVLHTYLDDKMMAGISTAVTEIPEVAANSDETTFLSLERVKLDKLGVYTDDQETIKNTVIKNAWEHKKKELLNTDE